MSKEIDMADVQLYLEVPFHQKDRAKELGAKWDSAMGKWYAPHRTDLHLFQEWWPAVLSKELAALHDKKPAKARRTKSRKKERSTPMQR